MNREAILKKYQHQRTPTMVYTRVMGYHRPVESFNTGKQAEHRERVHFVQPDHR